MTWSGREALPKGREWLGGPSGGPRVVERLSRKAGSGWEALLGGRVHLPEGWEWLGGPPAGPGVVGRP